MDKDTKKILMIATHLSQFFAILLFPLVVFLVVDDNKVKEHAKEVLNWSISLTIYAIISSVLILVLIGFVGLAIIGIIGLIFPIIGAIKASEGTVYRYPLTIRFLR